MWCAWLLVGFCMHNGSERVVSIVQSLVASSLPVMPSHMSMSSAIIRYIFISIFDYIFKYILWSNMKGSWHLFLNNKCKFKKSWVKSFKNSKKSFLLSYIIFKSMLSSRWGCSQSFWLHKRGIHLFICLFIYTSVQLNVFTCF